MTAAPTATSTRSYGVCSYCARRRPLRPDGLVAIHYLRYGTEQPRRRRQCKGSKHLPRQEQR